ncbi:MAG: hypothetical protein COB09_08340 [Thalassobium sp.]|nr:MAG: hypothetical protein COB09_08340 [Thalassobium sp.]
MKVKPMIFNTDMVRALLDGRKVQTRRPFKLQPFYSTSFFPSWVFPRNKSDVKAGDSGLFYPNAKSNVLALSGYSVGDLIYVRETFRLLDSNDQCDCEYPCNHPQQGYPVYFADDQNNERKWKPSIHMPRWASRLTLKVTGVRVERVQDISNADCIVEGFTGGHGSIPGYMYSATPKEHFCDTWQTIYGESWERNDWVWVIDFEVIRQNVDTYLKKQEHAA